MWYFLWLTQHRTPSVSRASRYLSVQVTISHPLQFPVFLSPLIYPTLLRESATPRPISSS